MILFTEDWQTQYAQPDTSTRNESAIRMWQILKDMGVKNNMWHLALVQDQLRGIDPHDVENLTPELKYRIAIECKINPIYFYREVVRIPQQGGEPTSFKFDRANLALIWIYFNGFDIIEVIPRQHGKTIGTICISSEIIYIRGNNINISMITKDNPLRIENVARLKDIRDSLPSYLVSSLLSDSDNKEGLTYKRLKNRYQTYVARSDHAGADNLGRGMTTPFIHWDEPATLPNLPITYPAAVNSTNAAVKSARANGQPCSNILTTTAGKLDTKEGRFCYSLIQESLYFTEHFYDVKDYDELHDILKKGSPREMFYINYNYLQLGSTHEWFEKASKRSAGSQDDIDRDFKNIWKHGSRKSILNQQTLSILKEGSRDPSYIEIRDGFIIRWYVDRGLVERGSLKNVNIVLGMDCSEMVDRDYTTLVFLDSRDMSVLATCACNEGNLIKLAMLIFDLMMEYPRMTYIPERNSVGVTVLYSVLNEFEKANINPWRRIYNEVVQNLNDPKYQSINLNATSLTGKERGYFGFRTTGGVGGSRKFLYNTVFSKAMGINCDKIFDNALIDEICGLTVRNGRIDHLESCHDDLVIAYLLACYLMFAGKNLSYYGFDYDTMLSQVSEEESEETRRMRKQQDLQRQIKKVENMISGTKSRVLKASMIRKLTALKRAIDPTVPRITDADLISDDKKNQNDTNRNVSQWNQQELEAFLSAA